MRDTRLNELLSAVFKELFARWDGFIDDLRSVIISGLTFLLNHQLAVQNPAVRSLCHLRLENSYSACLRDNGAFVLPYDLLL